jgi:hypothetical protein
LLANQMSALLENAAFKNAVIDAGIAGGLINQANNLPQSKQPSKHPVRWRRRRGRVFLCFAWRVA